MGLGLILLLLFTSCSNLEREVLIEENVHYLISPRGPGLRPALVIAPDCFGVGSYFKERASQFAKLGYHTLILDLNGKGLTTKLPGESRKLCENQEKPKEVFKQALDRLRKIEGVDGEEVSAIGYGKGADLVFELGREGTSFKNIVLIQSGLYAKSTKSSFKDLRVLILNGALDPSVNSRVIQKFKKELKKNQLTYEFVSYPGARQGFYKPEATKIGDDFDLPFGYDEEADKRSTKKIIELLKIN